MDQYEAAANITFEVNSTYYDEKLELPVISIDATKDVGIEQIRANNLLPIGYGVTDIEHSGSLTFDGNGFVELEDGDEIHLEELFTNDDGVPITGNVITIYHDLEGKTTEYTDVMITSDGYETDSGEVSGISFDWIAGDRDRDDVSDD